ncbi:MAG: hypothetical protein M0Q38_02380 [Bacteroidales bacterium]|jgi:hypothetical protein|nr:hypothetical protein [Bacteroidales bacterium]
MKQRRNILLAVFILSLFDMSFAQNVIVGDEGSNNTTFENDGTMVFNGNATVWDDIQMPGIIGKIGVRTPTFSVFRGGLYAYSFDTPDALFFQIQIQHSWKQGSPITPHIHISPSNGNSGNTVWHIEYCWANVNKTFRSITNILDATIPINANDHQNLILSFGNIAPTEGDDPNANDLISSILMCKIYRDNTGLDTYASKIFLLSFDVHYEKDTEGSREQITK